MAPSSTTQRPPTITRSARCAPHSTSAASGSLRAGEAQFVQPEQRQIGRAAGRDAAEFRAADAGGRPLGRPAQRVAMADAGDTVAMPLQQERRPHLLHQIGGVVGGRAVHAEADAQPRRLHVADRAMAGAEHLVAARAMRDGDAGTRQPRDLAGVEMHAMRQPDAIVQPADLCPDSRAGGSRSATGRTRSRPRSRPDACAAARRAARRGRRSRASARG